MTRWPALLAPLACLFLLACSSDSSSEPHASSGTTADGPSSPFDTSAHATSGPDASSGTGDPTDATQGSGASSGAGTSPTEALRPNVQEGSAPNAPDQTPAFAEQTRAPQPAEPTAFRTEVVASGLGIPWGIAPLPDGRLLVTERSGNLRLVGADGSVGAPIEGVPQVAASGQGGLLDVVLGPDFATDRSVFLTFAEPRDGGHTAPAVARGTLSADATRLDDVSILYRQEPSRPENRHFGSRMAFAPDGTLFATFGDRGAAFEDAQSPFNSIGAVIRILPDGSIPEDNPFADGENGAPAVWSWGHRNIQSATIGTDGALWTVEHGPQGGDELNRPDAGVNHGWPIITYGVNYGGRPVGQGITEQEGMAQPVYYWDPVIAPSGMATYRGDLFPDWEGDFLIGGLQSQSLVRLSLRDGLVHTEEWLPMSVRVRSVAVAPDGTVLVGTDAGEIVAILPE
ncbi:MAG: PQQ-dependent sugar dehydrogenase [Deltaproteobacteria bacterium]|nr:MAG: PQQ-dependent sugar dehydrogenase [Deltaproteobacteria bacterium]